jgi:uncharacterized membrane protein
MKRLWFGGADKELITVLVTSSLVSVALLAVRVMVTGSGRLTFLLWNLFLAWLPLGFAWLIYLRIKKKPAVDWKLGVLFLAWLGFLPNAFYLTTDLIHLQSSGEVGLLYDTAMIVSFVLNGLVLGYLSLFLVQRVIKKYTNAQTAFWAAQFVLLLSAFAIYLGRYLRWNTWDIIINPLGLAFDISDRIVNPGSYQLTFVVTGVFYVLLGSFYALLYRLAVIASKSKL